MTGNRKYGKYAGNVNEMYLKTCPTVSSVLERASRRLEKGETLSVTAHDFLGLPFTASAENENSKTLTLNRRLSAEEYSALAEDGDDGSASFDIFGRNLAATYPNAVDVRIDDDGNLYITIALEGIIEKPKEVRDAIVYRLSSLPLYIANPWLRIRLYNLRDETLKEGRGRSFGAPDGHKYYVIPKSSSLSIFLEIPFSAREKDAILTSLVAKEICRSDFLKTENIKFKYYTYKSPPPELRDIIDIADSGSDHRSSLPSRSEGGDIINEDFKYGYLSLVLYPRNANTDSKIDGIMRFVLIFRKLLKMHANALKVGFHNHMRKKTEALLNEISEIRIQLT